jgi:hypothetical protein
VASDDAAGQANIAALPGYDRMPLDAANGAKKSATKQKKKKANEDDDGDSQNELNGQGGLVVNGIIEYIRALERRVSELEKKVDSSDFN